jgi:hypothetical protein
LSVGFLDRRSFLQVDVSSPSGHLQDGQSASTSAGLDVARLTADIVALK